MPSYLSSRSFAKAVLAILDGPGSVSASLTDLKSRLPAETPEAIRELVNDTLCVVGDAEEPLERFQLSLEQWFDDQMDRVSGWYRRWSRPILLVMGLVVAVLFNSTALPSPRRCTGTTRCAPRSWPRPRPP